MGSKQPTNELTLKEEITQDVMALFLTGTSLEEIKNSISEYIDTCFDEDGDFDNEKLFSKEGKKVLERLINYSELDNQNRAKTSVARVNADLVASICQQYVREYKCNAPSEKALAELAAVAFVRYLQASRVLSNGATQTEAHTTKNGFFSVYSKEADRSLRQHNSTLALLRDIKQPSMNVTVKTHNAFIADKQQINAERNNDGQ